MDVQYRTRDLYLAAYLKMKGFPLVTVEPTNGGRRGEFVFEERIVNGKQAQEHAMEFFAGEGDFVKYVASWKDLRAATDTFKG
jgi:hypothetical protein